MATFAKLFHSPTYGQLLVMRDTNDDNAPCVVVFFQPDGLGVGRVAVGFSDDERGDQLADKAFARMDLPSAEVIVKTTADTLGVTFTPDDVPSK